MGQAFDRSPNYERNYQNRKEPRDKEPCVICGKTITGRCKWLHLHEGDLFAVTEAEAKALNEAGEEAADMGVFPIGLDCLRKRPELKPYAQD